MWYENMFIELENNKNLVQAKKMSAYMQDKFEFLGIEKPRLKLLIKPYLKEGKKLGMDWNFVNICWQKNFREAQYIAIEFLNFFAKNFTNEDLPKLKELIISKSWWETVDSLDSMVGFIVSKDKSLESTMLEWSKDDNVWLKRVAIDFQQRFAKNTNEELLEKIIINNFGSKEFFINKAIGWSLREYAKTNPLWVKNFIEKYSDNLSSLSIKKASKV